MTPLPTSTLLAIAAAATIGKAHSTARRAEEEAHRSTGIPGCGAQSAAGAAVHERAGPYLAGASRHVL